MLLLIIIFTWHPLKEKIPNEQVPRDLLSCECEKSFQFIPKENLLLSTGAGWRVLEKSSLDCTGDGDGLNVFWTTVQVQYLNLDIAGDIENISSSLPESYASRPRSEMWHVMFFISHFGNLKDFKFRTVVFLAEWFLIIFCAQFCLWGRFFHCVLHCVYFVDPNSLIFIPNIS